MKTQRIAATVLLSAFASTFAAQASPAPFGAPEDFISKVLVAPAASGTSGSPSAMSPALGSAQDEFIQVALIVRSRHLPAATASTGVPERDGDASTHFINHVLVPST